MKGGYSRVRLTLCRVLINMSGLEIQCLSTEVRLDQSSNLTTGFPLTTFLATPSWYTPRAASIARVRGLKIFRPSTTTHTTTYSKIRDLAMSNACLWERPNILGVPSSSHRPSRLDFFPSR